MSLTTVLIALAAFVIAALVPQGSAALATVGAHGHDPVGPSGALPGEKPSFLKQRLGLGLITALTAMIVLSLMPDDITAAAPRALAGEQAKEWPYLLTFLIFVPLVGSIGVLFLPRQGLKTLRYFTYAVMGLVFVVSLWTLRVPMTRGWHFQHVKDWIPAFGIRYHVALDGISLWMVILTTFITPIAAFASFGSIKTRVKELCFSLLFLEAAMIGAFVALDLFLFYVFWELMLVPMYLMIGIWGGADKIKAAIKFFLYTMGGSVLMLAAILYLVWTHQKITGQYSFDYLSLVRVMLPDNIQFICFWAFSIAFFIKVPMWPVHTWLPDAHVQAPTGGSVILAAVMLKLGTYAYMRFSMGLFPYAASEYAPHVAGVAILGGIVWAALVAWKQDDVKKLIAYSSVAHLGYIMLGLFGATPAGMQGAVLQMVNHGISTGALFLLVGVIYDRKHTRLVKDYGGIAKVMPVYTTLFLIATFASVGVPGTNGFVGEFMVIMGTYASKELKTFAGVHAVAAAFGVILAAIYMLSVVQKVFFGKLAKKNRDLTDISPRETLALAPLILMIFVIGFFPSIFLSRTEPAIALLKEQYDRVSDIPRQRKGGVPREEDKKAHLLSESLFDANYFTNAPAWGPPPAPPAVAPPALPATAKAPATATAAPTAAPKPSVAPAKASGSASASVKASAVPSAAPSTTPSANPSAGSGSAPPGRAVPGNPDPPPRRPAPAPAPPPPGPPPAQPGQPGGP